MIRISNKSILYWIYFLFVVCVPFSWAVFLAGSFYRSLTIMLFILFLLVIRGKFIFPAQNTRLLLLWTVFFVYILATLLWSKESSDAFSNILSMGLVYATVLVFATFDMEPQFRHYIDWGWVLIGAILAALYFMGAQTNIQENSSRVTLMITGVATDPNEFAGALLIPISLGVYYVLNNKNVWIRLMHILLILVEMFIVLNSGSRGALVAVVIGMLVTLCIHFRPSFKRILFVGILLAGGLLVLQHVIFPLIPESVVQRFSLESILKDGGSGRDILWQNCIDKLAEGSIGRLIFGYGNNGILVLNRDGYTGTMHNQLLQMVANYGFIGLGLYLFLLLGIFINLWKRNRKYIGPFLGMMALSMTLSLPPHYKPLWVLLLMAFMDGAPKEQQTTIEPQQRNF